MSDTMELPPLQSTADEGPVQIADSAGALSLHTGKLQSSATSDDTVSAGDADVPESHHAATQEATPTSDITTRDAYVCDDVAVSQKLHDVAEVSTAHRGDSKELEQAETVGNAVPAAAAARETVAAEEGSNSAGSTTTTSSNAVAVSGNGSILNGGYASEESDIEEPDESRPVSKTNHYGIFMTSDRAGLVLQVHLIYI
jgi:hypothetical protein